MSCTTSPCHGELQIQGTGIKETYLVEAKATTLGGAAISQSAIVPYQKPASSNLIHVNVGRPIVRSDGTHAA